MRNKIIVATFFAGALSTAAFAHGNNMSNNQGMHNGMNGQTMNNQGAMQNQQNMMSKMHNMMHSMMNSSQNSTNMQGVQNCLNTQGNTQGNMQGQQNMMGMHKGIQGNHNHDSSSKQSMHGGMSGNSMMHNSMAIFSKLHLDNTQKNKLTILHKEMFSEMQKVMHPMGFNGMGDFIGKDGFDKESFKKTMNTQHQKMIDFKVNHMDKVLKVLTKEQLSQLTK